MINIEDVKKRLLKRGICIYPITLKIHDRQGKVNEIWTVDSNRGKLLMHVGKNHPPHLQYQKAKKVFYLSKFLFKYTLIPSINVLDFGKDSKGNVYTIEEFVECRSYEEEGHIKKYRSLAKIIAHLHQIKLRGAGYLFYKNGKLQTVYKTWRKFLSQLSYDCLQDIYSSKKISKKEYISARSNIKIFLNKNKKYLNNVDQKLMHGDLTLGNILFGKKDIEALVDWEFSCVGDPAWEFAAHEYLQGVLLDSYFLELKQLGLSPNEKDFRERIAIYDVIKELIIANSLKKTKYFKNSWLNFKKILEER